MDSITLRNFRCFRQEQTARLAPLTLLVGENSTGKTSFLAMIRALWDLALRQRLPDFKEDPYDLGSFDEIAHYRGGRGSRADTFAAGFEFIPTTSTKDMGTVIGPCRFEAFFGKKGTIPFPIRGRLSKEDHWIEYLQADGSKELRFGVAKSRWQIELPEEPTAPDDLLAFNFLPILYLLHGVGDAQEGEFKAVPLDGIGPPDKRTLERISSVAVSIWHERAPLYASAPIRSKPRRTYDPSRTAPDPEGDYIPMYLANVYFQNEETWPALKSRLEDFGKAAGLFDEITIRPLGKRDSEPFQVHIRKGGAKLKGPRRNLIDVGYGVSQVLPLITELLRQDGPPMFLLQQPEVHLHPSAQAALGSLFCQVARPERQLIVETHSDHLLDRVRMDVRDGTAALKPEDVSILFFERKDLDVRIHSLRIDEEGNILEAPDGYRSFFLEETARSLWKRDSGSTKRLIDDPRGKVYSTQGTRRLLGRRDLCRAQ